MNADREDELANIEQRLQAAEAVCEAACVVVNQHTNKKGAVCGTNEMGTLAATTKAWERLRAEEK